MRVKQPETPISNIDSIVLRTFSRQGEHNVKSQLKINGGVSSTFHIAQRLRQHSSLDFMPVNVPVYTVFPWLASLYTIKVIEDCEK